MNNDDTDITLDQMVACVEREIGLREKHYPRWIDQKKLLPKTAMIEIARMKAVREQLIASHATKAALLRLVAGGHVGPDTLRDMIEEEDMAFRLRLHDAKAAAKHREM